jgi:hypothetical protein
MCIGLGPAWEADDHGFKSNEIIARRQFARAVSLWNDSEGASLDITGVFLAVEERFQSTYSYCYHQYYHQDYRQCYCYTLSLARYH